MYLHFVVAVFRDVLYVGMVHIVRHLFVLDCLRPQERTVTASILLKLLWSADERELINHLRLFVVCTSEKNKDLLIDRT